MFRITPLMTCGKIYLNCDKLLVGKLIKKAGYSAVSSR